jgi:predicted transcriptional regulator YdeE
LYEDITTQSLAEMYEVPERSLWRYFRENGGYSVADYVRLRKTHLAAHYLRHGSSVNGAFDSSFFRSKTNFIKVFTEYYGISPWEFARTKGMELMTEPTIVKRPAFHIVGYSFRGTKLIDWEDSGAYYIIQDFPEVSAKEWARIGGGCEMIGTWTEKEGDYFYVFGPGVREVQYIPEPLMTVFVEGGIFAAFSVEKPKRPRDNTVLCENVQVTWYYALKQWLPDSDYEADGKRTPYEYYLDGNNLIYVPIVPKIKSEEQYALLAEKAIETI